MLVILLLNSLFVVWILMTWSVKPPACPGCQGELPAYRKPANLRQLLLGGWTCSVCGCEVSAAGRRRR